MTAEDHIVAWIESSRPHYDRLLALAEPGKIRSPEHRAFFAMSLVRDAYSEMLVGGDASRDDLYSPAELLRAAILLTEWELV